MKKRCSWAGHKDFKHYGGRGIRVCDEWMDFSTFHAWALDSGYSDDLTIDRYPDRDGNYEPGNCRWATQSEQIRNQDRNSVTFGAETKTLADFAREAGLKPGTVSKRLSEYKWSLERALTTPARQARRS
jgi:hypothetical protein